MQGVGEIVAKRDVPKILLLNGSHDRETSVSLDHGGLMTAKDVVKAITSALNRGFGRLSLQLNNPTSSYVTTILAPEGGAITLDRNALAALGIRYCISLLLSKILCLFIQKQPHEWSA